MAAVSKALEAAKKTVLHQLEDAAAEAQNDNFDAAVMWAMAANETWQDATGEEGKPNG
jgi:hypothetical protein